MFELKSYRIRVEANVERVNYRARHRNGEMSLIHRRHVGQHHCDGVILRDAVLPQGAGKPATAAIGFAPTASRIIVDEGTTLRVNRCGPLDKSQR